MKSSTKRTIKFAFGITSLLAVFVAGPVVLYVYQMWSAWSDMCVNTILRIQPSPDKRFQAVVFERNCGATTGFSTQISILEVGKPLPDDSGNVFVADTDHGRAPSGPGGGPEVLVEWLDSSSIRITHDPSARVFCAEENRLGVAVNYEMSWIASGDAESAIPSDKGEIQDGWRRLEHGE